VVAAIKIAGLRHLARIEAEGQRYGSPKNGRSEANRLAIALCAAKLQHAQTRLDKVVTVVGGNSD
jgi:hypothetical protein